MNRPGQDFPVAPQVLLQHELGLEAAWGIDYLKLLECTVLILGVGGFGTHVSVALARMGVRNLILVDRDKVSYSNVPRQVLFTLRDVGRLKVEAAVAGLEVHRIRSAVEAHAFDVTFDRIRLAHLIQQADFVFTLFDARAPTLLATWLCRYYEKPMVSGGVDSTSGFTFMYRYQMPQGRPCEECYARSAVLAPPAWKDHYLSLRAGGTELNKAAREFGLRSCAPPSSPIAYTSACLGSQEMVNVFLRHRMEVHQPTQVRINAMNHQVLISRGGGREDCVVCGSRRLLVEDPNADRG